MKKISLIILTALTAILFSSCAAPEPAVKKVKIIPVERIVKRIEANRRKIKTFYGSGVLKIDSDKLEATANFEVEIKKPDSIKLSVFGPFGLDVGELLVTNEGFEFYDALKNKFYTGKDKSQVLGKIFQSNLNFSDVIDAFVGSVNFSEKLNATPDEAIDNGNEYYFSYDDGEKRTTYKIKKKNLNIEEYNISKNGNAELISKFSDFEKIYNVSVPYRINIQYPKVNGKVLIDYRVIKINDKLDKMELSIPQDAEVIIL